ncbi:MAG: twin-arginine translocase TatA/TatE family subunit [Thermoleophilia bacterium]|nr:twin-arginine translocase TatA/TatE family subunit [Thermoleophilia bacterium]
MGISWQELIVVLLIVLVLFGPKRLPEIGTSLGRGIRGFKDSMNGRDQLESSVASAARVEQAQQAQGAPGTGQAAPVAQPVPVEVVDPADQPR